MRTYLQFLLFSFIFAFSGSLLTAQVTSPCESGFAGVYPCSNYDLVGLLDLNGLGGLGNANDIWGWTDPQDGTEYALVGLSGGTAFVDISSPTNPVLIGTLPTETSSSTWRDIKVYQDHAFIVSEAGSHGMQVFDLSQLRTVVSPPITFSASANYNGFGSAHNIVINEESGYAYGVGARTFDQTLSSYAGGLHFVDISSPLSPVLAGGFALDGYTHDAQVVNYIGPDPDHQGQEIAFASNEDTFTIVDVTDKTDPTQLSRTGYAGSSYTHQGWATEDHRFYLMNDELDENSNGHNTRTYIWNIEDLDNPIVLGFYDSNNSAIDHNLYIKGDLAFQSNYSSGLRVLDISDIANANLTEVGFFDVYPLNDNLSFNGTWSNYPYFDSGNIIVTSQTGGLFIVRASEPVVDHCTNGVQDADETGVDCGGVDCDPCPPPCGVPDVTLSIVTDRWGAETTWQITDGGGVVASGGPYVNQGVNGEYPQPDVVLALSDGDYSLTFFDSFGDGMCCAYGNGSYSLTDSEGTVLASGGTFVSSETTNFCLSSNTGCEAFATAPVDLTKSFDPVNGVQDRVQVKWYKDTPQVKYSDEDAAMCDIKFWAKRNLDPVTGNPIGPTINNPDTVNLVDVKKTYGDNSPREIFKWPVKFRADGVNNNKRAEPNIRYEWQVRCECGHDGSGPESPWSAVKIFNTPDFDPSTGIYTPPPGGLNGDHLSKSGEVPDLNRLEIFPNPSTGQSLNLRFEETPEWMLVEIFDLSGKLLYTREIMGQSANSVIQLNDLNIWQPGLYLISVETTSSNIRKVWSVSSSE